MTNYMQTTDDQNELFTLVDEKDNELGTITRSEAHNGTRKIHRSTAILVYNSKGELFMHQRSLTKDVAPGYWTISAGGHVTYGATYVKTARREIFEELGILVQLTFFRKILVYSENETEIDSVFKAIHDGPFKLNQNEIADGRFFSLNEIEKQIMSGVWQVSRWTLIQLKVNCGILRDRTDLDKFYQILE